MFFLLLFVCLLFVVGCLLFLFLLQIVLVIAVVPVPVTVLVLVCFLFLFVCLLVGLPWQDIINMDTSKQ